jgi:hypothetical protein
MKSARLLLVCSMIGLIMAPVLASATPNPGVYFSTDMGGVLQTGRASTWRPLVNSGFPHVLHGQSWNGSVLGAQWDIDCAIENTDYVSKVDKRIGGNGTIDYVSRFLGGTLTLYAGAWPWGDGVATLDTTMMYTSVQYMMIGGISTPVASVVNGNTRGTFAGGCTLIFGIANGSGAGETPYLLKPATFPVFQDGTCAPAALDKQFGTWGSVITITMGIYCEVGVEGSTWGAIKELYR